MSVCPRWTLATATVLAALLLAATGTRADFDLPILNPVPKIVSVPEDADPAVLGSFTSVRDLVVEIRMTHGNMLTDRWIELLGSRFAGVPKRIVLRGKLKPVHVDQLRQLSRLEVIYQAAAESLDQETIESLFALGPVHKTIVLAQDFPRELLDQVQKLKYFVPAIRIQSGSVSPERLAWLGGDRHRPKVFYLPADFEPERIYDLLAVKPLQLDLQTKKNRLDDEMLAILKDLRGVELTLVVDGMLTVEDARRFARLDRFALRIELGQPPRTIPGLALLLNRIAPP